MISDFFKIVIIIILFLFSFFLPYYVIITSTVYIKNKMKNIL